MIVDLGREAGCGFGLTVLGGQLYGEYSIFG
jgi:hypothetical protein